jgi:hypothetical protein
MLPLTVLLVPHAAHTVVGRLQPWLERAVSARFPSQPTLLPARAVVALLLVVPLGAKLLWFSPGLASNPRAAFAVPEDWAETSRWLSGALRPGERYAAPHTTLYSTWDQPRPDPDARWISLFTLTPHELLSAIDEAKPLSIAPRWDGPPVPIRKILVDAQDKAFASYQDKLSPERDQHGALAFLGWPRCFADHGQPSRFSIYCRPSSAGASPAPGAQADEAVAR